MPAGEQHAAVEKVEHREQAEREEGKQPRRDDEALFCGELSDFVVDAAQAQKEQQKEGASEQRTAPAASAGEQDAPRKNGDKGKEHGKNGGRPPGKDEGKGRFLRAEKAKEGHQGGEEDERPKDDVDGPFAAAAG